MRVLHLSAGNMYGGVERVLVTLARCRALCPEIEPEFGLCFSGRVTDELRKTGVPVHLLGEVHARNPLSVLRARRVLRYLVAGRGFDAVICHSAWPQAIFGAAARAAGVPSIFWLHDAVRGGGWVECWAAMTVPDLAICNSRFTARTLDKLYPGTPVEVVYCPVPAPIDDNVADVCSAVRTELRTAPDAVVMIQVSRMEEWKGHRLHLKALSLINDVPGWTCWIVGGAQRPHEARYLRALQAEAAALGIAGRVRFTGHRGDVARLLGAANIHCQPNTSPEPFGISFIEALYARLPVVTTALGGALEIVDDACGILVPPDNPAALAEALRSLITDRRMRARLGGEGPARAIALCDPHRQMAHLARTLRLAPGQVMRQEASENPT